MRKDYSIEEIDQISDVYLLELKTEKRYELENYMPKGGYSIHLYTYETIDAMPGLNLCIVVIANHHKYVSDEIKLERILGTFCAYKVRNIRFVEENKRQFKRVGYLKPIQFFIGNTPYKGEGINISAGGLCMRIHEQPRFRFCEVVLHVNQQSMRLKCQLIRFERKERDMMYTLHLKFVNIDKAIEQQLCGYVLRREINQCREARMRKTV